MIKNGLKRLFSRLVQDVTIFIIMILIFMGVSFLIDELEINPDFKEKTIQNIEYKKNEINIEIPLKTRYKGKVQNINICKTEDVFKNKTIEHSIKRPIDLIIRSSSCNDNNQCNVSFESYNPKEEIVSIYVNNKNKCEWKEFVINKNISHYTAVVEMTTELNDKLDLKSNDYLITFKNSQSNFQKDINGVRKVNPIWKNKPENEEMFIYNKKVANITFKN